MNDDDTVQYHSLGDPDVLSLSAVLSIACECGMRHEAQFKTLEVQNWDCPNCGRPCEIDLGATAWWKDVPDEAQEVETQS